MGGEYLVDASIGTGEFVLGRGLLCPPTGHRARLRTGRVRQLRPVLGAPALQQTRYPVLAGPAGGRRVSL